MSINPEGYTSFHGLTVVMYSMEVKTIRIARKIISTSLKSKEDS